MLNEHSKNVARNVAYQQVWMSHKKQDDKNLVLASETFFKHAPLSGKDNRNQQVMNLYTESFVRWFTQQETQINASTQERLEQYRKLVKSVK